MSRAAEGGGVRGGGPQHFCTEWIENCFFFRARFSYKQAVRLKIADQLNLYCKDVCIIKRQDPQKHPSCFCSFLAHFFAAKDTTSNSISFASLLFPLTFSLQNSSITPEQNRPSQILFSNPQSFSNLSYVSATNNNGTCNTAIPTTESKKKRGEWCGLQKYTKKDIHALLDIVDKHVGLKRTTGCRLQWNTTSTQQKTPALPGI